MGWGRPSRRLAENGRRPTSPDTLSRVLWEEIPRAQEVYGERPLTAAV